MKISYALICLVILGIALKNIVPSTIHNEDYEKWKKQHQITFISDMQDFYRMQIFKSNLQKINKHNERESSYSLGLNQFSAMTPSQFASAFLHDYNIKIEQVEGMGKREVFVELDVDWVTKGAVLPVKNSGGMCAASYAVSSAGALEGLRKIKNGELKKLSEQEIIDCTTKYGNSGCSSGLPVNTFKYVVDNGISDDSQYPYTGTNKACQKTYGTFKISSHKEIKVCQELEQALMNQPVSVLVDASNWMLYRSGIFNNCSGSTLNLAVLLVGMTDTYWRVRNQWGTSWGEQGYIRLAIGNCCSICTFASVPLA